VAIGGQVSVYRSGSDGRLWNCLLDRHPGDMETYGRPDALDEEIVRAGNVCGRAAARLKSTTCLPDGVLAKDSPTAAGDARERGLDQTDLAKIITRHYAARSKPTLKGT
jgi:hypothetical protein